MSSSFPSPLYFHLHCPPSYVALLSSHCVLLPLHPPFLDFRCPHYSFISYLVQLRNSAHPSYHSNFCDLQFTTVLHISPLTFTFLSHNTADRHSVPVLPPALRSLGDFGIKFAILRQRRSHACEYIHSL